MSDVVLSTRVGRQTRKAMQAHCDRHGLKIGRFIEEAILDKIEEADDVRYIQAHLDEPARPIEEVLRGLTAVRPVPRRRKGRR